MKFPITKKSPDTGIIVKFIGPKEGFVLDAGSNSYWQVGDYHDNWISCTDRYWLPVQSTKSRLHKSLQKSLKGLL